MATPTVENYLKALHLLANEKDQINVSDLSEVLHVSTPTANSMAKKLNQWGLIIYEKYRPLTLTEKGKDEAAKVIRKHRLTEMYLVEMMGFGWEEVHEIAEQIEHIQSPPFFDRMDALLGHPTTDPHGSPIPDKNGFIVERNFRKLGSCQEGDQVKLSALAFSSSEFLQYLNEKELQLGVNLKVLSKEAFDGSITLQYENHPSVTLSKKVAEILLVEG
ncbi:MAG: metal-dependent transcriptional regulator [Saprospiraceae bacterium]|nr:metal-dependent transcriptional regulator [Saprospiraceae bacterium]